jgi:hypothetical protein
MQEADEEVPLVEIGIELPVEEVSEVAAAEKERPEPKEIPTEPTQQELIGISEEKLEAIVTRVVQDVVERVVRETISSVAEKVIVEAIDALKQSLESASE